MPSSSRRMLSFSASESASRARRATCSTSCIVILGSGTALKFLKMHVFEGEALAADAGKVHGGDDIAAFPLDADQESLAPARVAELGAHPERQIVVHGGGRRGDGRGPTTGGLRARRVQQPHLVLGNFEQKARGLSDAVALDAPVQRIGEPEPLLGARDPDVEEPALLLKLLGVIHGPRVWEDALLEASEEDRGELEPLG